ncbi:hypothetical protein [Mucilaginibacter sp.]|jgi:hypothetical protein|uniref:hypothetical protein n=1 Tax=Mucilaginibacter sp. TaxID=1882438 RepID=UPI00356B4AC8
MNELLKLAIDAQGGLNQWRKFNLFTARFINSGELWTMKGHGGTIDEVGVKVNLLEQKTSHIPNDQWHTAYTPDKIAIESADGDTIAEMYNPRASYAGHVWETEWTPLQLAYFTGYATWNYINTPYQFTRPGFELSEGELWEENGEVLRTLKVKWPKDIHTHCPEQTFYINSEGFIKRLDYRVDVAGSVPCAHYLSNYKEFQGIKVATKRMVYLVGDGNRPIPNRNLIVGIDLRDIKFQ